MRNLNAKRHGSWEGMHESRGECQVTSEKRDKEGQLHDALWVDELQLKAVKKGNTQAIHYYIHNVRNTRRCSMKCKQYALPALLAAVLTACGGEGNDLMTAAPTPATAPAPVAASTMVATAPPITTPATTPTIAPVDPNTNVPPTVVPQPRPLTANPQDAPVEAANRPTLTISAPTGANTAVADQTRYAYTDNIGKITIANNCFNGSCGGQVVPGAQGLTVTIQNGEVNTGAWCGQLMTVKFLVNLPQAGFTYWRYGVWDHASGHPYWQNPWSYTIDRPSLAHVTYMPHPPAGAHWVPLVQVFQPINGQMQLVWNVRIPVIQNGTTFDYCVGF